MPRAVHGHSQNRIRAQQNSADQVARRAVPDDRQQERRADLALVERGGSVRSFHVAVADQNTVCGIVRENVARESHVHADESRLYNKALMDVRKHEPSCTPPMNMCAAM
jgi:hypothetical protein